MSDANTNTNTTGQQGSYLETAQSAAGILGGHAQLANGAAQVCQSATLVVEKLS